MLGFWLLILMLICLFALVPWWPYSRGWGYWPGSGVAVIIVAWVVLMWIGIIAVSWPWAQTPPPT
jgi:hypothetical protein